MDSLNVLKWSNIKFFYKKNVIKISVNNTLMIIYMF
jgi:hypothetical protein